MPRAAEKLLERMRASKASWAQRHLEELLVGFGFTYRVTGRDRLYFHPDHPEIFVYVPRHSKLLKVYVANAVKAVDRLKRLEADHG